MWTIRIRLKRTISYWTFSLKWSLKKLALVRWLWSWWFDSGGLGGSGHGMVLVVVIVIIIVIKLVVVMVMVMLVIVVVLVMLLVVAVVVVVITVVGVVVLSYQFFHLWLSTMSYHESGHVHNSISHNSNCLSLIYSRSAPHSGLEPHCHSSSNSLS